MKTKLPTLTNIKLETNFLKQMCYVFLLFSGMAFGQIVNIPDANFKAKLLSASPSNSVASGTSGSYIKIDNNNDGEIQQSEALLVNGLDVSSSNISNITGIQSFTNLNNLNCSENGLYNNGIDLSLLINLLELDSSSCNLFNLDLSSLNGLTKINCSNNNLTSLNLNNLSNLTYLNLSANNLTSLNLNNLINLNYLNLSANNLSSLNLSSQNSLVFLSFSGNNIENLNFSNLTNLTTLECNQNQISQLNIGNLVNLTSLDCSSNNLATLDLNGLSNLTSLKCNSNNFTNINFNNLINLTYLDCSNNNLGNINVSSLVNLNDLFCSNDSLTNLDLNNLTHLKRLHCNNNLLTSLNLSNLNSLTSLICENNLLTSLDVSSNINLTGISFGNPSLNPVDLTMLHNIHNINFFGGIQNSIITNSNAIAQIIIRNANSSFDLSNAIGLYYFSYIDIDTNPNLTNLNLKVGQQVESITFKNNPSLLYVCTDSNSILNIYQSILTGINNNPNVNVNSYCSFSPGGNYNTITGSIIFDANNNGCDASDLPQPNIRININDGVNTGATFTNNLGTYNFYTQTGSFVLTPDTENPTWFTFSPATATIPFANNNNNTTTTQNFCIAANGVHNDVEVVVEPIMFARPGFDAVYKIVYKNKGNQTLSGDVNFIYDDSILDFVLATLLPTSQSTGVLNWSYTNLMPFENRSFYVTLHVNAPTDTPPVNIGDVLSLNASITPMVTDENPLDNSFTYNQTVVGSFDPNNITCLEGAVVPPSSIGNYLHYGVNFENTGTYPAENIVVKVVVDTTKYDINSLQMLNTSHPAYSRITGNIVEFIFKNIMLDTGGHGNVLFKIKSLSTLAAGDMVSKRADIYFDYNAPVNTGMANTTFQSLNNGQFVLDSSIMVSPNPTSSLITINGTSNIKSVEVYDVQGRLLEDQLVDDTKTTINISDKTNGIYFLKITTEKGSKIEKIVKE